MTTTITLITLGVSVATTLVVAATTHHAVSQWCGASVAILLFKVVLVSVSFSVQVVENILSNISLQCCSGATKFIEVTIEPLIDLGVELMVVVADLLWGLAFLTGLGFRGSSILICTANVDGVVASEASVSRIDIR